MPQIVSCAGCGNNIFLEQSTPIQTCKFRRVIGHVHKTPPYARKDLIPACHRLAYENLKHDYPTIVIDGRTFNKETVFVKSGRKSGTYRIAEKYARRNGEPMLTDHTPRFSSTPPRFSYF